MTNPLNSIRFSDEFEKELYNLSKKYRSLKKDIEPIIQELEKGNLLAIANKLLYKVFKYSMRAF